MSQMTDIQALPAGLDLRLTSRHPARLSDASLAMLADWPMVQGVATADASAPLASIIIVTHNNAVFTKLCLQSVLANTDWPNYEVIVVDNASDEETRRLLREVTAANPVVRVIWNDENRGFAPANNQGLAESRGEFLVL